MKGKCILFVDDEPFVLSAIRRLFRKDPVEILCAGCGREGLEILARRSVGLIVSDYMMPGMNGVEFLCEARRIAPLSRRILLSGHGDRVRIESALTQGDVHEILSKPWNGESLRKKLLA